MVRTVFTRCRLRPIYDSWAIFTTLDMALSCPTLDIIDRYSNRRTETPTAQRVHPVRSWQLYVSIKEPLLNCKIYVPILQCWST